MKEVVKKPRGYEDQIEWYEVRYRDGKRRRLTAMKLPSMDRAEARFYDRG